jgi:hypothetical protein
MTKYELVPVYPKEVGGLRYIPGMPDAKVKYSFSRPDPRHTWANKLWVIGIVRVPDVITKGRGERMTAMVLGGIETVSGFGADEEHEPEMVQEPEAGMGP